LIPSIIPDGGQPGGYDCRQSFARHETERPFSAVFSRYETDEGRFVITSGVEEFFLRMGKNDKTAVIGISVLLKDAQEKEIGKSILFQKKYVREEPLQEASPNGYCQAASKAMRVISEQITNDIYAAIKTNIQSAASAP